MRGRNRAHVKARIRDIAADIYGDEQMTVSYSLDTTPQTNGYFLLLDSEGTAEPEDLAGTLFTDRYVQKARIEVHGEETAEAAEAEVERLLRMFDVGIATPKALSHPGVPFDTDPDTDAPYFDGVQTPWIGQVDGPQSGMPQSGGPIVGWVEFDIEIRCHINRST